MADIEKEIQALSDLVEDVGFDRILKMYLPKKYTAGELSIRFLGDSAESETGSLYRIDREYQFIIFGTSERDCLAKAVSVQRILKNEYKVEVEGSGYLTLGLFSYSQPFKSEDSDDVYVTIGVLQAEIREVKNKEESPIMDGVNIIVNDSWDISGGGACK